MMERLFYTVLTMHRRWLKWCQSLSWPCESTVRDTKKFGSLKENFFFQEMKIEEKRRDEEWDRLMNTQAEIADSYQREIDRKKA